MRPENEWFAPERLERYYFTYEVIALVVVLGVVGVLAVTGILAAVQPWVVVFGGALFLLGFGYLTWWIPTFVGTADYRLTDEEIDYRRGVFFQQKTTVPYTRITNVDASQGPIQRLVDAGSVGVHTAGYGGQMGAELTINGVADFEDVKEQILDHVRRRRPEATEGADVTDGPAGEPDRGTESRALLVELRRIRELLEDGLATAPPAREGRP